MDSTYIGPFGHRGIFQSIIRSPVRQDTVHRTAQMAVRVVHPRIHMPTRVATSKSKKNKTRHTGGSFSLYSCGCSATTGCPEILHPELTGVFHKSAPDMHWRPPVWTDTGECISRTFQGRSLPPQLMEASHGEAKLKPLVAFPQATTVSHRPAQGNHKPVIHSSLHDTASTWTCKYIIS